MQLYQTNPARRYRGKPGSGRQGRKRPDPARHRDTEKPPRIVRISSFARVSDSLDLVPVWIEHEGAVIVTIVLGT